MDRRVWRAAQGLHVVAIVSLLAAHLSYDGATPRSAPLLLLAVINSITLIRHRMMCRLAMTVAARHVRPVRGVNMGLIESMSAFGVFIGAHGAIFWCLHMLLMVGLSLPVLMEAGFQRLGLLAALMCVGGMLCWLLLLLASFRWARQEMNSVNRRSCLWCGHPAAARGMSARCTEFGAKWPGSNVSAATIPKASA